MKDKYSRLVRVLFSFAFAVLSAAGVLSATATHADGAYAITCAQIHTLADAGTLENGVLLINAGRIEAVGADLAIPAGYEVLDAAGRVVRRA